MSNVASSAVNRPRKTVKSQKKSKVGLIILISFVVLVVGFVALVAFNVFGLRDNVIMPFLRNVPLIGNFVPEAEIPYVYDPTLAYAEREAELLATIASLEERLGVAEEFVGTFEDDMNSMYQALTEAELELERLREFEQTHVGWSVQREAFERDAILNNEDAFMNFFEAIHPQTALDVYTELTADMVAGYRRQHYLNVWSAMSAAAVAQSIQAADLILTDMPLIVSVFRDLPHTTVAAILNNLDPVTRALITVQMYTP